MRISLFLSIAVCTVALCAADIATAQRGGGRPIGGRGLTGSWLGLLRMETVQDEIELVPDQLSEIEGLQEEMWGEMQERMSQLRGLDQAERRQQFANLRTEMEERQGEYKVKIEGVLLPMQLKRLKELNVQNTARRSGSGAVGVLKNDELLDELGVDDEQRKALEEKAKEVREKMSEQIKKLQKKAEKELLSVLTPEQQKMYREKVGETFDFGDSRDPGFSRGVRGDRGGRNGRGERADRGEGRRGADER